MNKPISYNAQMGSQKLATFYCHNQASKRMGTDGEKNMATLREEAQAYTPAQTLNIADLDKIPIDVELKDGKGKTSDGEEFTYKYATINGQEYRVAGSIIGGIKALLGKIPTLKYVSVIKQGTGMNTKYQVVPLMEQ